MNMDTNKDTDNAGLSIESIAASLRAIRKSRGLTLKDVEKKSQGKWKAVVIGSYERCDRALSLNKAVQLATFYKVPLDELLGITSPKKAEISRITFDTRALGKNENPGLASLKRFLNALIATRRDWNGEIFTIRGSDVSAVSALLAISEVRLHDELLKHGLLFTELRRP